MSDDGEDDVDIIERVNYDELNVSEVRELTANIASVEVLLDLREHEVAHDDRKTAKEAIDERVETLEAADIPDDDGEDDAADGAVVAESDTTPADDAASDESSDHGTLPRSAAQPTTVVVRNPHKTSLQLPGLRGTLDPGQTREYPESDTLHKYIRENKVQVVTSR